MIQHSADGPGEALVPAHDCCPSSASTVSRTFKLPERKDQIGVAIHSLPCHQQDSCQAVDGS